jgi:SAM-dependent methyltransferase
MPLLQSSPLNAAQHRLTCNICNYKIDPQDPLEFFTFPCNIRAHWGEHFRVWRCPTCATIHCLEIVDLDEYYKIYPNSRAELSFPLRMCYRNIKNQFIQHQFSPAHSLLDYGCANAIFTQYLKEQGFHRCYAYDPYGSPEGTGNPAILQQGPFDYILLQDVLEHVEDPHQLLHQLDQWLVPGGHILIGLPGADRIDLTKPHCSDFYNAIHVPCHLHLFTKEVLADLGHQQGWEVARFYDRGYDDTRWFALNARTWNAYARLGEGSVDCVFEPINLKKALRSPEVIFFALFGYWLSFRTSMAMMFRKPI